MKKNLYIVVFIFVTIFVSILFCETVFATPEIPMEDIISKSGTLQSYTTDAISGNMDFKKLFYELFNIFAKEFKSINSNFPILFTLSVIFALISCISIEGEVQNIAMFACRCVIIMTATTMLYDLINMAIQTINELSGFTFLTIPTLCGLMASSGMVVSSAKSSFIILGTADILAYITDKIFLPLLYIAYIFNVCNALVENNIFLCVKNTIVQFVKATLPIIVGTFVTVLAIFMNVSVKTDTFVFKTAKTTIGNMVPFLGNALSGSAEMVVSSLDTIRAQVGIAGVLGLLFMIFVPITKVLCSMIAFKILAMISGFLSDEKTSSFYDQTSQVLSILCGMMGTMAIILIISIMALAR